MATAPVMNAIYDKMVSRDKGAFWSKPSSLIVSPAPLTRAPDFRYMATSDLLAELQKEGFKADAENERKICTARPRGTLAQPRPAVLAYWLPYTSDGADA